MAKGMTNRKKQAIEMKSRIRKAALELFDRRGFDSVAMEDIAEAAGCSVGNIYHYFSGKSDLVQSVTDNVDESYGELEERFCASDNAEPADDLLIEYMGESLAIDCREELLFRCFIHNLEYPEQGTLVLNDDAIYVRILKYLAAKLELEGKLRAGVTKDDIISSFMIINRGVLLEWRIENGAFDPSERGRHMITGYLKGVING